MRWLHIDPERGKKLWADRPLFTDPRKAVDARVADGAREGASAGGDRRHLARRCGPEGAAARGDGRRRSAPLGVLADAVVGAALAAAGGEGKDRRAARVDCQPCRGTRSTTDEDADARERALAEVRDQAQFWLDTGRPDLALDRSCLHWPLAFPEVFLAPGRSGFDAIVGNPPFLGGQAHHRCAGHRVSRLPRRTYIADGRRGARTWWRTSSCARSRCWASRRLRLAGDEHDRPGRHARGRARPACGPRRHDHPCRAERAWPGTTSLEIAKVWIRQGRMARAAVLSGARSGRSRRCW